MSDRTSQPGGAGETAPAGEVRSIPGAEVPAPGQPPTGLPNGPGIDQWGRPLKYAPEDPSKRTGAADEAPLPDPASTPAGPQPQPGTARLPGAPVTGAQEGEA